VNAILRRPLGPGCTELYKYKYRQRTSAPHLKSHPVVSPATCLDMCWRLFLLVCLTLNFTTAADASTNFTDCLLAVRHGLYGANTTGARDNRGNIVIAANATALSYDLCTSACGTGPEPFSWTVFSSQFSAWLLPWLALVSQLPFGSQYKADDVTSVLLTIGSPTLAAYSLVFTVLNGQWISRRLTGIRYPNVNMIWRVLSSFQQSALLVDDSEGMLASLLVLPENDDWWKGLAHDLDYAQTWSPSMIAQIIWVVIAYCAFVGFSTYSIH
jgi:hypothetical protein